MEGDNSLWLLQLFIVVSPQNKWGNIQDAMIWTFLHPNNSDQKHPECPGFVKTCLRCWKVTDKMILLEKCNPQSSKITNPALNISNHRLHSCCYHGNNNKKPHKLHLQEFYQFTVILVIVASLEASGMVWDRHDFKSDLSRNKIKKRITDFFPPLPQTFSCTSCGLHGSSGRSIRDGRSKNKSPALKPLLNICDSQLSSAQERKADVLCSLF